jgi:N-acetylglucosamine kinase-like BadF-type ATPase
VSRPPAPADHVDVYLGVDGGGTKTALCLLASTGQLVATLEAPSCYYLGSASSEGTRLVERVLGEAVPAVCAAGGVSPADVTFAFLGLPAYGEVPADLPALDAAPRAALGHARYRCANDMVCGWAGSLGGQDGINVISGTGSMTYGEHHGRTARVGGWGELFGDEGSGHWIGLQALQTFSRMSDGRAPAGPLLDLLRGHLALRSDLDLVDITLNRWQVRRREVAALSPLVVDAARHGDVAAAAILAGAAEELALLVEATRRRLGFGAGEQVPVSYSGGVFSVTEVLERFTGCLAEQDADYELRTPLWSPVVGAALYAARLSGAPLGADALGRLAEQCD